MSFRGGSKSRTRNLEIPGSMFCIAPERREQADRGNRPVSDTFVTACRRLHIVAAPGTMRRTQPDRASDTLEQQ
ncbi:hypothetical protein ACVWY3_006162 [Bradyrhizobium sp. USDA 4486]